MDHRYIVVEGPIGVGKTSLCNILAQRFGHYFRLGGFRRRLRETLAGGDFGSLADVFRREAVA